MFWKFDRLARDHDHTVMIKMLLRHEYGLKLYCVEGFSEDDDNSPYTAMMEQMIAVFSAFYSMNLSSETKRGKRQRAMRGEFNGSVPPLGYILVVRRNPEREKKGRVLPPNVWEETPDLAPGLYIDKRAAALVRHGFRLYSTGKYSDNQIARWLMEHPYIQKLREGLKPLDKEMVRDLLQNRVYTGRVRHTDTIYKGSLGERRTSKRHRSEWFEGKHEGFISDELFEECQLIREGMVRAKHSPNTERIYVLHDRVYCARCVAHKPHGLTDENYGRMRPKYDRQRGYAQYRCLSYDRGYEKCGQRVVTVNKIDEQLVDVLSHLKIPEGFRERVEEAVRSRVENDAALKRIEEIKAIVERIDFSWEQGFLTPDEYAAKRRQFQEEMNSLRPIDYDELTEAADLLTHFNTYWRECEHVSQPEVARQQLIGKIVERVFVYDQQIVALVLHGDFGIVLGENEIAPAEVTSAIYENLSASGIATEARAYCGDDGVRCLLCTRYILFRPLRFGGRSLSQNSQTNLMSVITEWKPRSDFSWRLSD